MAKLFFDYEIKESKIIPTERGLFTKKHIPPGEAVAIDLSGNIHAVSTKQFQQLCEQAEAADILKEAAVLIPELPYQRRARSNGVRAWKDIYIWSDGENPLQCINHSFSPNLVYCLGWLFSRATIQVGTELTMNYEFFLPQEDSRGIVRDWFVDKKTNKPVRGMNPISAMRETLEYVATMTSLTYSGD